MMACAHDSWPILSGIMRGFVTGPYRMKRKSTEDCLAAAGENGRSGESKCVND
jgi:hypothetical protein